MALKLNFRHVQATASSQGNGRQSKTTVPLRSGLAAIAVLGGLAVGPLMADEHRGPDGLGREARSHTGLGSSDATRGNEDAPGTYVTTAAKPAASGRGGGKVEYCTDCHGASGQGYRGYFVMPRLAGQTPEYIEGQLRAFVERRRVDGPLNLAKIHGVGPGLQAELARYFKALDIKPLGRGPADHSSTGKRIFDEGIPEANIPACAACHGPDGRGEGVNPRLAGQLYRYTVKTLTNWNKERGHGAPSTDHSNVMKPIVQSLNKSQIEAVSSYMSGMR